MKYRHSIKKAAYILAACGILTAEIFTFNNKVVVAYADEVVAKPEKIEIEEIRAWDMADSYAIPEGPALFFQEALREKEEDWKLILVNRNHPLPDGYQPETQRLSNGLLVDTRIYQPLMELLEAGNQEGCAFLVCSAYRPYERQVELYQNKILKYQGWGYSYEEACARTEETISIPGCSEHQAGLAVDIVTVRHQVLNEAFANTKAGKWLAEHAHEYGFILRYPKDKEEVTGISYEPWHFRYVGKEAAAEIFELGCCLEEYKEWK